MNWYLAAAVLCFSIAPITSVLMIPTNFELIRMNEEKGGARSETVAGEESGWDTGRSAEDSVDGEGQASQWTDSSGPLSKTGLESSEDD